MSRGFQLPAEGIVKLLQEDSFLVRVAKTYEVLPRSGNRKTLEGKTISSPRWYGTFDVFVTPDIRFGYSRLWFDTVGGSLEMIANAAQESGDKEMALAIRSYRSEFSYSSQGDSDPETNQEVAANNIRILRVVCCEGDLGKTKEKKKASSFIEHHKGKIQGYVNTAFLTLHRLSPASSFFDATFTQIPPAMIGRLSIPITAKDFERTALHATSVSLEYNSKERRWNNLEQLKGYGITTFTYGPAA